VVLLSKVVAFVAFVGNLEVRELTPRGTSTTSEHKRARERRRAFSAVHGTCRTPSCESNHRRSSTTSTRVYLHSDCLHLKTTPTVVRAQKTGRVAWKVMCAHVQIVEHDSVRCRPSLE
jgi:hypothetical protein